MTSRRSALAAACFAVLVALAVYGFSDRPAPGSDWPPGTLVVGRTAALGRLLAQLQQLEGTPIARRAAATAAGLPDCEWFEGRADGDAADVFARLRCRTAGGELAGLDRERGDRDLAFALPAEHGRRILGTLETTPEGDVTAEILLPKSAFASARALLLPAAEGPGPTLLSHTDELVHLRLRPEGGVDVASLVPSGSQADQMFRLKSELFAGAVLDGTWELAIYLPESGRSMPRSALAIGTSLAAPAVAAMEDFLADITRTWPVHRSDFALDGAAGACLLDLNVLPDLAPCYVATRSALVIGWNPASLRRSLAPGGDGAAARSGAQPGLELRVDLARFAEADAVLAPAPTASKVRWAGAAAYPWRSLTADGTPDGDAVRLRVRLAGGGGV